MQVPVTVVGRDGKPVTGLTAADFEVRDEGKTVAIETLDVVEYAGRERATPYPPPSPEPLPTVARRKFVLLFDLAFATPPDMKGARQAAAGFVREQKADDDLVAVATVSARRGFEVVHDFTANRDQLAAAIEGRPAPERAPPATDIAADARLRGAPPNPEIAIPSAPAEEDYRDSRTVAHRLLESLNELAEQLRAVPGRKFVVYFSRGFDARLLEGSAFAGLIRMEPMAVFETPDGEQGSGLQSLLAETIAHFRESDTVLYALDLASVAGAGGTPQGRSLSMIAGDTGGEVLNNSKEMASPLSRVLEATRVVYLLGFRPQTTDKADAYHRLKVKVRGSGLRVSARAGYFEGGRPPRIGSEMPTPTPPDSR